MGYFCVVPFLQYRVVNILHIVITIEYISRGPIASYDVGMNILEQYVIIDTYTSVESDIPEFEHQFLLLVCP